jgi:hypothetical protein
METKLVTFIDEVIKNIEQFNRDLKEELDVVSQLTMFKHWYYIPGLNMYGPSKYIGYKSMNTSRYNRGRGKTGVETEKILKNWFMQIPNESESDERLRNQLVALLDIYGKKLRSNAVIHIPKGNVESDLLKVVVRDVIFTVTDETYYVSATGSNFTGLYSTSSIQQTEKLLLADGWRSVGPVVRYDNVAVDMWSRKSELLSIWPRSK